MEKLTREYQLKADLLKKYFVENDYLEDFFTTIHKIYKAKTKSFDTGFENEMIKVNLIKHFIDWAEERMVKFYDFSEVELESVVNENFDETKKHKYLNQKLNPVTQCEHLFEILSWDDFKDPMLRFFESYKCGLDPQSYLMTSDVSKLKVYYGIKPLGHFLEDINLTKNTTGNLLDESDSELFLEASV